MTQQMHAVRSSGQPASERKLRAQGRRTLAKLLDAGLQAFGERGYHAARVDDVVRLAATSHGTFYLYFSNKEDLLRALARECAVDMQRLADELGEVTPDAAGHAELRRWVEGFYRTYTRYGAVIRAWMEDQVADTDLARMGTDAFATLTSTLGRHMAAARPQPAGGARPDLAPVVLVAMVERFTYFVSSRGLPVDEDQLLDELTVLVQRGFF
ncbi:MAG TPA: TetR family transcriptional regulator [Acidimicrobiales bacterium]|nr:TetR family transcriptional regulator [Acidimicrobiales bacterium]